MAYDGDCIEVITLVDVSTHDSCAFPTQCWDNVVISEYDTKLDEIKYMTTGGKIMFPVVYNFNAIMVDINLNDMFAVCTKEGVQALDKITQCPVGNASRVSARALPNVPGDDSTEIVLTGIYDLVVDFIAQPEKAFTKKPVKFINLTDVYGFDAEYLWEFGDGTKSNLRSTTHVYSKFGEYTVRLTVRFDDVIGIAIKKVYIYKNNRRDYFNYIDTNVTVVNTTKDRTGVLESNIVTANVYSIK